MAEAMDSVASSEPKRSYSWWWDSHITPKNSKWLQENLADMDSKIESLIMLIEEDADSFAKRAEMYYKKRPELMKLVEEFYRAYRALAERYDHVTGALRQAHRTIAVAFPNQIQFILPDEPPSALPDAVEEVKDNFTSPSYSNESRESAVENSALMSKEEWKQLNCLLADDEAQTKSAHCSLMKGLSLNNNLVNQIVSEPDISQNREEVCHLNDEICTNAMIYDVAKERCVDLEEVLDLLKKNQNLHNEMSIGSSILNMAEEQYIIFQKENNSLQHTVDGFKKMVARHEEEVTLKEEQSMKKPHSQCVEQLTPLGLGIMSEIEMRRMELSRAELGELNKFNDEDNHLNEKSSSYISKLEIADETKVQEDLSYYVEERYHELQKRIEEVNFNLVSLRALITELRDWNRAPKGSSLKDLRLMKSSTSVMNCIAENSMLDVNAELKLLSEKIKGLEYYCESVQRDFPNHESRNTAIVSHVEAADQNIKKLLEKSRVFEDSVSDMFAEFEGLRGKVKALEESYQSLFYKNCDLIAENSSLVAQLENIEQDIESLEDRFSNLEAKYVSMEEENDLLRSEKEGLENHIQILREENTHLNEELEDEQHKTVKSGIDYCIMQNFLYDMNETNLILSDECQKHMKKLRRAEKLASEFKHDQLVQEKILALLLEHDKKLSEWMHLTLMAFDSKEDCVTSEGGNKDMMHLISNEIVEQLGLSLVELRAQKNVLQHESEEINEEISFPHGKNYEHFTASYRQKEELKIEMEEIHTKISELLAGRFISRGEIPDSLSNKLYENVALKKESQALIHDHLSLTFSSDTEKSSTIDQLASDVLNLNGITSGFDHEIAVRNGNMRALQHGNTHSETKNVLPKDLEMNIQILLKENARKDDEIDFLRQSNNKFVKNAEALRSEKILAAELQRAKDECKRFEEESAACLFDIHVASINGLMYEEKIAELVLQLKNIEEGSLGNVQREVLKEKLHALENENKDNDITSLEELTLSPADHHILNSKKKQDNNVLARGEDHIPMEEVPNIEKTKPGYKAIENKAMGSTAQLETEKKKAIVFDSRKSNASDEDVILIRKLSNANHEHITKDIELDHVLSIRSDFNSDRVDREIEIMEGERSENPSSDFVLEKELSIDTIELPEYISKSQQEWSETIGKILSSDALRLTALQMNLYALKNVHGFAVPSTIKEQLNASEAVIMQLTDINIKLARISHNITASLDDHDDSERLKISDRVQRASKKIGEVELELTNTLNSLLKIQEEETKKAKALQRKSRISFMGFLYGRRADSRQKKRGFCSCMGLCNKDD